MFKDRDLWRFINTFAPWFSAIGTITAVLVSLYLSRREPIRLKVDVGIRRIFQRGVDRPEYFSLEVTNFGQRPAQIVSLIMRDGFYFAVKKFELGKRMVLVPPDDALSAKVPVMLTDGEQANYLLPWPEFARVNREMILTMFAGRAGRIRARLFRVGVLTSAGGFFHARVEKGLAQHLVQAARQREGGP